MTDEQILELTQLANALADGVMTEAQRVRLNEMLRGSEEARQFYTRFAGLGASLCDYAAELQTEEVAPAKPKIIHHPMAWWVGIGAAAAAVTIALLWPAKPVTQQAESVAWITGATEAQWSADALQPGDSLSQGQRLELASGMAEVTFDSGARVVIEGPASLDIESAWSAGLRSGAATASVPNEAAGFRVASVAVAVTSLGGDTRIEAEPGGAEVATLSGSAEAAAPGQGERTVLKKQQARRFAGGKVMPVANLDQKIARWSARKNLERKGRPVEYVRYNASELAPDSANRRKNLPNARTIAFWVRLPAEGVTGDDAEIVSFGHRKSGNVSLAWNTRAEHGPLGALRLESDVQSTIGRTALRDGQWHHVALMMVGNRKSGRMDVKQYVDGRLDGVLQVPQRKNDAGDERGFALFRRESRKGFRGEVGNMVVADRPLTPFELQALMAAPRTDGA